MTRRVFDLTSVYAKLDRAETHIHALEREVASFQESDPEPFGLRTKRHPGGGKSFHYELTAIIRRQPPLQLALTIGDVVHNLRSALDFFVYELSSKRAQRARTTQFPIFLDRCEFKVRGLPMINGVKGHERALIERVQPYATQNPPSNDPLAILAQLSNQDKHRLLTPTIVAVDTSETYWVPSDNTVFTLTHFAPGPVEHGAKVMGFTATPRDDTKEVKVDTKSALEIQLADVGPPSISMSLVHMMDMLHHHVKRTVIESWFRYGYLPPTLTEASWVAPSDAMPRSTTKG